MPSQIALSPPFAAHVQAAGSGTRFRPRMLLVVAAAILPLLAYMLLSADIARRATLDWLMAEVRDAVGQAAAQEAQALAQVARLLHTLARLPQLTAAPASVCASIQGLLAGGPSDISGVALHWPDSRVACTAFLVDGAADHGAGHVRAAMVADGATILAGHPTAGLVLAVAVPGLGGMSAASVLSVSLASAHLPALALPLRREQVSRMLIDPDDGTVLARLPDDGTRAGNHVQSPRLLAAMRARAGDGVVVVRDAAGVHSLFGYAALPGHLAASPERRTPVGAGAPGRFGAQASGSIAGHATLLVELPFDLLLAEADARRNELWLLVVLIAAGAALTAWALGDRAVIRPVTALLSRRPGHALSQGMALEALRPPAENLRQQGDLAVVADFAGDLVLRLDAGQRILYASPASRAVLGYAPNEMMAVELAQEPGWEPCGKLLDSLRHGAMQETTLRIVALRKDERQVRLEIRASRLADGGFALACRDIGGQHALEQQLAEMRGWLTDLALEDVQTGLANRRRFDDALDQEVRRAQRAQEPLALVLVALDLWPQFAEQHGDSVVADALRRIGHILTGVLHRPGDLAARYGEAVFAVLMPITDQIGLAHMSERLRRAFAADAVANPSALLRISIGGCSLLPLAEGDGPQRFVDLAEQALSDARQAGGNRAVLAGVASCERPRITLLPPAPPSVRVGMDSLPA